MCGSLFWLRKVPFFGLLRDTKGSSRRFVVDFPKIRRAKTTFALGPEKKKTHMPLVSRKMNICPWSLGSGGFTKMGGGCEALWHGQGASSSQVSEGDLAKRSGCVNEGCGILFERCASFFFEGGNTHLSSLPPFFLAPPPPPPNPPPPFFISVDGGLPRVAVPPNELRADSGRCESGPRERRVFVDAWPKAPAMRRG